MSGHLLCGCLALTAAFASGVMSDKSPGPTGLGGPYGARSLLWFFISAGFMVGAVR